MTSRLSDERGESLLELIMAVVILGLTAVAVLGGLLTSVQVSDVHRKQATAGAAARDYAEKVAGGAYTDCAGASAYAAGAVGFTVPTGFSAQIASVRYIDASGTSWTSGCSVDHGVQQVTVQVSSTDGRALEQAVVLFRNPCGAGSSCHA